MPECRKDNQGSCLPNAHLPLDRADNATSNPPHHSASPCGTRYGDMANDCPVLFPSFEDGAA
eukprot:6199722-Pleurochrysis_carterae.AAC.2